MAKRGAGTGGRKRGRNYEIEPHRRRLNVEISRAAKDRGVGERDIINELAGEIGVAATSLMRMLGRYEPAMRSSSRLPELCAALDLPHPDEPRAATVPEQVADMYAVVAQVLPELALKFLADLQDAHEHAREICRHREQAERRFRRDD